MPIRSRNHRRGRRLREQSGIPYELSGSKLLIGGSKTDHTPQPLDGLIRSNEVTLVDFAWILVDEEVPFGIIKDADETNQTLMSGVEAKAKFIDVNYVNVNAFYFYFTPILAEIDVKDIFYVLPCSYSQKGCFFTCKTLCVC